MSNSYSLPNPNRAALEHGGLLRSRLEHRVRSLLWSYLWLLVFEGAVRKWIPGLTLVFLLIRDPIALVISWYGAKLGIGSRLIWNTFTAYAALITILGLVQILLGQNQFLVFLYGWRSYVLHFPVIIVAQYFWRGRELSKVLRWFVWLSIPMTVLMCLQYAAPPSSFLNAGTTGSGQLEGALGHIRPPGTFSFITGPGAFYPIVAAICLFGLLFPQKELKRPLLICASMAVLLAIPISISRGLAINVVAVILCGLVAALVRSASEKNTAVLPRVLSGMVVLLIVSIGLSQTSIADSATEAFTTRWTSAAGDEGATVTLSERLISNLTSPFEIAGDVPLLGAGIGAGSNVAASLRGNGSIFSLGEGSVQREFAELGLIFGCFFLLFRLVCTLIYVAASLKDLRRGTVLSWLLIVPACNSIFLASLDQATAQGFLVVTVAIALGSLPRNEPTSA